MPQAPMSYDPARWSKYLRRKVFTSVSREPSRERWLMLGDPRKMYSSSAITTCRMGQSQSAAFCTASKRTLLIGNAYCITGTFQVPL